MAADKGPYYKATVMFQPVIEHVSLVNFTEKEYEIEVGLEEQMNPNGPIPRKLDQKDQFSETGAVFMTGEREINGVKIPSLTLKIRFYGDTTEDKDLLTEIHAMLRDPNSAKSALADDEEELHKNAKVAMDRLGELGGHLRQVWSAAENIAAYMPHMELPGGMSSPARMLSPSRSSGGGGMMMLRGSGGGLTSGGGSPNKLAESERARHAKLGQLVEEVTRSVKEVESKAEELPDVVAAYFKDCFAVLDPGLAMIEDSLVRDAAYAKLAKLRGHAATQATNHTN